MKILSKYFENIVAIQEAMMWLKSVMKVYLTTTISANDEVT